MKHRILLLTILAVVLSVGVSPAYAYFRGSGHGTGSGSVGTLTVTATTGTAGTPLIPGGTGDVALQVVNTYSFAITLKSVTGAGTITADSGHSGCTTTGVTFNPPTGAPFPITIAAGHTLSLDLTGAAAMSTASLNSCQGATFFIPVTIVVQS